MRLLVIDHEPDFSFRLRQILEQCGHGQVTEIADLRYLDAELKQTAKTVIILSTAAIGRGGIKKLTALSAKIIIIAIGGNDPERMRAALGEGARGYVMRTDVEGELPAALLTVLDGGVFVPPVVAMRHGGAPLKTVAGPVPAGFFREEGGRQLTPRQKEILAMIRAGRNNTEIAEALDLTVGTVKIHITAIFKALGVRNRTQAMIAADWLKLPTPP